MLMMKLETIEHAKFRAHAQIIIDKEKGIEAFEEYMKIAFPYLAATRKAERQSHIERLNKEVGRGPLVVQAQRSPTLRSRVSTARAAARANPEQGKRLYGKIGRSI